MFLGMRLFHPGYSISWSTFFMAFSYKPSIYMIENNVSFFILDFINLSLFPFVLGHSI